MSDPEKKSRASARRLAFEALWRVDAKDAYADAALDAALNKHRPSDEDRALATEIVYGVLRFCRLLDYRLEQVADRKTGRVERAALLALRIGAYQLLFLDRVPDSAAVNESVHLAPPRAKGFVNAVLRGLASKKEELASPETIADPIERLGVAYSHPDWMVKSFVARLGENAARELLAANNTRPSLTLRVNTLRVGRDLLIRMFEKAGIEARAGKWSPFAVLVPSRVPVRELPGWEDGLVSAQDEASQLAPLVLAPRAGESVLDVCAAPGTKSFEIMQIMGGKGRVVATDLSETRLGMMSGEALRLGVTNITRAAGDAREPFTFGGKGKGPSLPKKFEGVLFDRALVDAPCTGLGTIRKNPEIKWRRKPEDVRLRAELQRQILANVSTLVKPGGVLVYSTCTFTVEENEEAVAPLLDGGFEQEDPGAGLGPASALVEDKMLRAWPHLTGTDGFTIFKFRKNRG